MDSDRSRQPFEQGDVPVDPGGSPQQSAVDRGVFADGDYEREPAPEGQQPPPAFPDQPDPRDPVDLDEAEKLKGR